MAKRDALRSLRLEAEGRALALRDVRTPAIVVDEAGVAANIEVVTKLLGTPTTWRAHCKTARSERTIGLLIDHGVRAFKTASVAEAAAALAAGALDVLYALPAVGPVHRDLVELAECHPHAQVSALLDSDVALAGWSAGPVGFFLDVNSGLDRSGVSLCEPERSAALIRAALARGFRFAGLHHYDGHLAGLPDADREERVRDGLQRLSDFATGLDVELPEIVTGGSHTFLPALRFQFPSRLRGLVTVSPGTVVYSDLRSLERLGDIGLRPALAVLCRVVSAPTGSAVTVDAGLTALQVDAGLPHAAVSGRADAVVDAPSQAHLSVRFASAAPQVGDLVALVPRHVDTALAQFCSYLGLGADGTVRPWPLPRPNPVQG